MQDADRWAYVDESLRIPEGLYVMAAAVVDVEQAETHRDALRALLLRRQPRIHWRDEQAARRERLAAAVGELELRRLVVVGTRLRPARQVRARRKCLERLLWRLADQRVNRVICEGRGPAGNRQDRQMIDALRTQGVIPKQLRVGWGDPYAEPLLWIGDIVAGAVTLAEAGNERYRKLLGEVTIDRFALD
jgi:hypothetical protein